MNTLRPYNLDHIGYVPFEAWGGGPDGDGTDLFGDCHDPGIHRSNPDADRAAMFLAADRGWRGARRRLARSKRPNGVATYEVTQITPTVWRRRPVQSAQGAA